MLGVEGGIFGEVVEHDALLQRLPQLRWPLGALA